MRLKSMYAVIPFLVLGFLTTSCKEDPKNEEVLVKDADGNEYTTVTIGTQTWMVENLKTTKYRNGDPIANVTDGTEWSNLTTGAYCNYENEDTNATTYGRLYNWYAVADSRNIAPLGWHVPTDFDYYKLAKFIDANAVQSYGIESEIAGAIMKEVGYEHWDAPNVGATDQYGFKGVGGGARSDYGSFLNLKVKGYFWTKTEDDIISDPLYRNLLNDGVTLRRYTSDANSGFSVRLVKD